MILIEENELIHVDSCDDVLEHFGVKGMKWGNRKVGAYAKSYGKYIANSWRHPNYTRKADWKTIRKGKLLNTHRRLDYVNKYVDDRVAAKKQFKADRKHFKMDKKALDNKYSKEARNSDKYLNARNKLKDSYKKSKSTYKQAKKSAGGNYKDAGKVY